MIEEHIDIDVGSIAESIFAIGPKIAMAAFDAIALAEHSNLSGQGRTGIHHRGLPYPSSRTEVPAGRWSEGKVPQGAEYPTEQSGALASHVEAWMQDAEARVGLRDVNLGQALALEFGTATVPARAPLLRSILDGRTTDDAAKAVEEALT